MATCLITGLLAGFYPKYAGAEASTFTGTASFTNYVNSTPEAYQAMQELPADQPLDMLNLIRFRESADYPAGSDFAKQNMSGLQAYMEYGRHSSPILEKVGGRTIYNGIPQLSLIGPKHESWDAIFIISYPNAQAFLAFVNDPEYKKHAFHRKAAVADSRLIRLLPQSQEVSKP